MRLKPQDKYTKISCFVCHIALTIFNTRFLVSLGFCFVFCLWRRLWRSAIRGNLKMILAEIMCRTAVCKFHILRWGVLRGLGRISLRSPAVLWEFQKPEEEFLSSFLSDDVQLVVMPQSTGHLLIGHVVSVLVVSPETCQSVGVDHPEHQAVPVFPSDVFLVTVVTQELIHIVPQQPALWEPAVGFVQWTPWLLSTGEVERLLDDALLLGRALSLVVEQRGDSCRSICICEWSRVRIKDSGMISER